MTEKFYSSHSQLDTYSHCSHQWWLSKKAVDSDGHRLRGLPAAWFHHGTAVHSALEAWERSGRTINPTDVFYAEYDRLVVEDKESHPDLSVWLRGGRAGTQTDIDNRREQGAGQVAWYMEFAKMSDFRIWTTPDGEPALELGFEIELGGVTVRGYIDAVWEWPTGEVEPIDLKTGTKVKSAQQLGLYSVALEKLYGFKPEFGRYVMLKHGKADPVRLDMYTERQLGGLFAAQRRGVENNVFLPNTSDCFACTMKPYCAYVK